MVVADLDVKNMLSTVLRRLGLKSNTTKRSQYVLEPSKMLKKYKCIQITILF